MTSIRSRLLVGTAICAALAFAVAGIVIYLLTRSSLYAQFDSSLEAKARALSLLVELDPEDGLETEIVREGPAGEYFELWNPEGKSIVQSATLGTNHLERRRIAGVLEIASVTLPDQSEGRQALLVFAPRQEKTDDTEVSGERPLLTIAVARTTADVDGTLARLARLLIGVALVATLACLALLVWIVRWGLAPVRSLAGRIAELREDNLTTRLDPASGPVELRPVVERLDDLLHRLARAFDRERALTAEVAHELRTPLAGLRSTIEVALDRERTPDRYRTALGDCLVICKQTERIVESMLSLAKLDAGTLAARAEPIALDDLVRAALAPLAARAAERELSITTTFAPITATTDRAMLEVVVNNLLENAVSYAEPRGSIRVEVSDGPTLRVTNTGCALTAEQARHVFERFWRGDEAREAGTHAGLGLALCKKVVELLGGNITATVDDGAFVATVVLAATSKTSVDRSAPAP